MDDLIKALQILRKYANPEYPSNCDHDCFRIHINPELVGIGDIKELEKLGFDVDEDLDCFTSSKFGSC